LVRVQDGGLTQGQTGRLTVDLEITFTSTLREGLETTVWRAGDCETASSLSVEDHPLSENVTKQHSVGNARLGTPGGVGQ
jgi:hypothetical protein